MISISPYNRIGASCKAAHHSFKGSNNTGLIETGDQALNENKNAEALEAYKQALSVEPNNESLNRKIAKAYHKLQNYSSAEENFKIYLERNQDDAQAWIELGEAQRLKGSYSDAIQSFEKALSLDENNDLAKRSILEAKNNELSIFAPQKAAAQKRAYAQQNLQQALQMTVSYLSPEYMRELSDIQIKFGHTASMGGTSNIAQYENSIKTITVSNDYQYAAPEVIAAYLVHESIHAHDKDAYTSVREEQDAYVTATKFWIQNSNGIKDPEMDYAANLYKKSPDTLKKRVEEIYVLRDPSIAKTSPNHPPHKKNRFSFHKQDAANQPLATYNIIA